MINFDSDSVICAVATPPGVGGISVVRICGINSEIIVRKLCKFLPATLQSHRVYYGHCKELNSDNVIDEVLVSFFEQGRSFTGNPVFEISCHGGSFVTKHILEHLINAGARLAEKGEFSYRAFENGRIDLVQAESILSLIKSNSKKQAQTSLQQLQGQLSQELNAISDSLTLVLANLEANIDFAHEDIELVSSKEFVSQIEVVAEQVKGYIKSYSDGKKFHQGINITLVGLPNAGKSSFLNHLLGYDKAIVSEVPGTTRDIVEASIVLNGISFNFFDTAGIHPTLDLVEKIGIDKSFQAIENSDFVLYLHDITTGMSNNSEVFEIFKYLKNKSIAFINTKSDLACQNTLSVGSQAQFDEIFRQSNHLEWQEFFLVSSSTENGLSSVFSWLNSLSEINFNENSAVIIQARHYELLSNCLDNLYKSKSLMVKNESPEFIASSLHSALTAIYEILGKTYDDQVMDKVFNQFCIGK